MARALIDPRLLEKLTAYAAGDGFYPDTCAIQQKADAVDAWGQPIPTWSNLSGHTAIHCRVSPAGTTEIKAPDLVTAQGSHIISLAGSYPTITPPMRAVVNEVAYDILGVENDGNGVTTRLRCQIVV